jgi:hypothetical protein
MHDYRVCEQKFKTTSILQILKTILQEKAVEATKHKEIKRKKPKPEEQKGMPHRKHCPREERRRDRNP